MDKAGYSLVVRNANASNSLSIFDPSGHIIHTISLSFPLGVAIAPDGSVG